MQSSSWICLVCLLCVLFVLEPVHATPLNTGAVTFREHRVYQVSLPDNYDQFDQFMQWMSLNSPTSPTTNNSNTNQLFARSDELPVDIPQLDETLRKRAYLDSLLSRLESEIPLDYWSRSENQSAFMIPPDYQVLVEDYLLNNSLNYNVLINDVQQLIDVERENNLEGELSGRTNLDDFNYEKYHPYEKIVEYLQELETRHFNFTKYFSIGRTYEQNRIPAIKIGPRLIENRPLILIDAGIHAREWIAPAASLHLIRELVRVFESNQTGLDRSSNVLKYDWIVIPTLNPDGYIYSFWNNRMWRKNRNLPKTTPIRTPWYLFQSCLGADPNRNFDLDFGKASSSSNPCSNIFAGDNAFSERESIALRDLILDRRPLSYVSLHSYSQLLMFPNGAYRTHVANHDELKLIAGHMAKSMAKKHNIQYRYGPIAQTIYPASGSSTDWSYWKGGVKYPFVFELRDTGRYGFLLPNNQIRPTGEELWEAMKTLADQLVSKIPKQ